MVVVTDGMLPLPHLQPLNHRFTTLAAPAVLVVVVATKQASWLMAAHEDPDSDIGGGFRLSPIDLLHKHCCSV